MATRKRHPASTSSSSATGTSDPSSSGRREQKKRDKRDRLRAAAWELFVEAGFDVATTRAIAAHAGIAHGTLFLYAKDKADLLFLVFEHRLAACIEEGFRTLPAEAGLVDQLLHLFRRVFAMYDEAPELGRHFVKELPFARGLNAERVNLLTFRFLERVAGMVESAQANGRIRPDAVPPEVAQVVFAIYFMNLLGWLSGLVARDAALDRGLRRGLELLEIGLRVTVTAPAR